MNRIRSCSLLLCLLLLDGCAVPHRSAVSRHVHKEFRGRTDGLVAEDVYLDRERGGGLFLMTDPDVATITALHTNQTALGGGSIFTGGPMSLRVDPQASSIIQSAGSAAGNVVGAAVKTALKP